MKKLLKCSLLMFLSLIVIAGCTGKKIKEEKGRESDEVISNPKVDNEAKDTFKIYDVDSNTYELVEPYDFSVKSNESLNKKVDMIVKEIMDRWFVGLEYKTSITKEDNKQIVVIDLVDKGIDTPNGWYSKFQGSTGGRINSKRIINNIIQKDYKGEWVQGVKVLYNGQKAEFEHAPELGKTIYDWI